MNDGTDDVYASHAWYEFKGQLTDIAISKPLRPDVQPRGPLTIQGIEFARGHRWTYHREMPLTGVQLVQQMMRLADPNMAGMLRQQEEIHVAMQTRSSDDSLIRAFLDQAPDGWTYQRIASAISPGLPVA